MKTGPDRYGPTWKKVKALRCFVGRILPNHRCGLGVTSGHTAHHWGRLDLDGLLPCCGLVHDWMHGTGSRGSRGFRRKWALDRLAKRVLGMSLEELALEYSHGDDDGLTY